MPVSANNEQLIASKYFESFFNVILKDNIIPEDISELKYIISKKKNTSEFLHFIYDQCFNVKDTSYNKHITKTIKNYVNCNDELYMYEKSEYYIFDIDKNFIRTKEGNYRNWIYAFEIDKAYNDLQDELINLEIILEKKQLLIVDTMLT